MPRNSHVSDTTKKHKGHPPIKYCPSYCDIAREELAKVRSIVAVAAKLDVARCTIYAWRETYPDFNDAIIKGQQLGEERFEGMAVDNLTNKNFNAILWSMIGRKLYAVPETRLVKVPGLAKCKTYDDEINCIRDAVANGEITTKEGTELSNIIAVKAKTYEQVEAKRLLEELQAKLGKPKK